jgi:N-succinyldiaminopimelate aminotransferase
MNSVFSALPTTVFEVMSRLARQHDAINLGQGFPDHPGPESVRQAAAKAVVAGWNQYPPMMGLPVLREAIADHYRRSQHLHFDPETEVMITSGATEALAGACLALIEPGDEVVLFEPLYDAYLPLIRRAGGIPRLVPLLPPDWRIDPDRLKAAFTDKTRLVVLNTPLNPAGSLLHRADMAAIARLCVAHDVIAISDEVWEEIVFEGETFHSIFHEPDMRERAVKIGSAGKMFSMTGWKVGFVTAAPRLMAVLAKAHQFLTFTTPPNLQAGVAHGLTAERGFLEEQRQRLRASRDLMSKLLAQAGFAVLPSAGTYFINADIRPLTKAADVDFAEQLVREWGVAAIPVSAFYAEAKVSHLLRFCFAKTDETLQSAGERLNRRGRD